MSDHHDSEIQLAAAREADRRSERACHDVRKLVKQKTQQVESASTDPAAGDEDASVPFTIRELHGIGERTSRSRDLAAERLELLSHLANEQSR
jgi:hypothetical protein